MSLNKELLKQVQSEFSKQAFVPMSGGQGEPVAGASDATAALTNPMAGGAPGGGDPNAAGMAGGDPSMGGMPPGGDPSMGGMPMDPAMMGGDPSAGGAPPQDPNAAAQGAGVDPAMLASMMGGATGGAGTGQPMQTGTLTVDDLLKILTTLGVTANGGGKAKPKGEGAAKGGEGQADPVSQKLDQILNVLQGVMGSAPTAGAAPQPPQQ